VQPATRYVEGLAGSQLMVPAADARGEGTRDHVDPLVLSKVHVSRHAATCIQANLHLQEFASRLDTGLHEHQALARDRVVELTAAIHGSSLFESGADTQGCWWPGRRGGSTLFGLPPVRGHPCA